MKIKLVSTFIAALLLAGAFFYNETRVPQTFVAGEKIAAAGEKPKPFPDLVLKTRDGQTLRVKDMKEPTVLIHFWAAWCAACHEEFPGLIKYVRNAHGRIGLVSISLDDRYEDSAAALKRIEEKYHVTAAAPHLYWLWDEDKSLSLHEFNTVKVPETIVVNKGLMIDKIIGAGPWAETSQ